jgi:hypothetical protein
VWADAYLEQARSDWQVWDLIRQHELPSCHALHYLQMTCEKLGKAFLITGGALSPEQAKNSHAAFKRFLQVASRNPALQRLLEMNSSQFRAHIKKMLPLAEAVERLAPALAQEGPNVEYPWQSPDRKIHAPARHDFPVLRHLLEPSGLNLIKIVDLVLQRFYRLFT